MHGLKTEYEVLGSKRFKALMFDTTADTTCGWSVGEAENIAETYGLTSQRKSSDAVTLNQKPSDICACE